MNSAATFQPARWQEIKLVVFDVDGTLYRQRLLRALIVRDMLWQVVLKQNVAFCQVLRTYRRLREELCDREAEYREDRLVTATSASTGVSPARVWEILSEWIERRPLPYLARCRYPALAELFAGIKRQGKTIGVLSDYPARAKLAALGLTADHLVSAGDEGVRFLKPHPGGLSHLLELAGVTGDAAVLIGDRVDRDGLAARRLGVPALIRSPRPIEGWQTFASYDAPLFAPLLAGAGS